MNRDQMKKIVMQWKRATPELKRVRDDELRGQEYDWKKVDAVLDAACQMKQNEYGDTSPPEDIQQNGLVLMQAGFIKVAKKLGLIE